MARSRLFTYFSLGGLSAGALLAPHASYAASVVSVFNPIIDQSGSCLCTGMAPSWGCVLQAIQNVTNVGIAIGVIVCVLYLAYAGILFMMSSANPGLREQGKARLVSGVVGMLVILGAWITVDFVMKVLYDPTTAFSGTNFGPWNNILGSNGNDYCIQPHTPTPITSGTLGIIAGSPLTTDPSGAPLNGSGTGSCSAATVQAAANSSGDYNLTSNQANALACLAQPESSCGAKTSGAKTSAGQATSAAGPWQILIGQPDKCHSLNIPACGNLNCSAAYSGGKVKSDAASVALANQCQAAANNLNCSAAAAACLIQASGGKFTAWTGTGDGYSHSAQKDCVTKNGFSN